MPSRRMGKLPDETVAEIKAARIGHGWIQAELGRRAGLTQSHVSSIETGRIVPRFDTMLDLVRVLDLDLVLAPRSLVPSVRAHMRYLRRRNGDPDDGEPPLYAPDEEEAEDTGTR